MPAAKGLSSLALLFLLLSPGFVLQSEAQPQPATGFNVVSAVWGTPTTPIEAAPGSQNVPLTITLQYYFFNPAQGITVTLSLPDGFTDTNGNSFVTAYPSGQVPSGTVLPLTFYLDIGAGVAVGSYTFPMTISWGAIVNPNPLQSVALIQNAYANIAINGKVNLNFKPLNPSLSPGVVNDVRILLTNNGTGSASQIQTSVTSQASALAPPTASVLSQIQEISNLSTGSSSLLHLRIYVPASSANQPVTLTLTTTYHDSYGNPRTVTQVVGLYVRPALASQAFDASAVWGSLMSPLSASPGSTNVPLSLTIYNLGPTTVYNVMAMFNPSSPLITSRGQQAKLTKFIPMLPAGSSFVMIGYYDIASQTGKGVYNESLTLSYSNGTSTFTQSRVVNIPIIGSPIVSLSRYSFSPSTLYPGITLATLQVYLVNAGTAPAANVTVTLQPSDPVYPAYSGSMSTFIGFMPVGTSVPVTFALGIRNSSLPQNTTLSLVVALSGSDSLQFKIPFYENPKAIVRVDSVATPTISIGDSADYVTITVRNTGSVPAQFTTFTILPSNVFQPSIPSSESPLLAITAVNASVGTVMPGQNASFTFVIQVSSSIQPGVYPLTLLATWRQFGSAATLAQEIRVLLTVKPTIFQTLLSDILSPVVAGVVLVAVVGVAVVTVKRRGLGHRANTHP